MDLLLIQRDALASSLLGSLQMAITARQSGREVAVLFTQEALAALARGSFEWPRELSGQEMRLRLAANGAATGLPVSGRGEGRQVDAKGMVARAIEAGVALYACSLWTSLLGLDGTLPEGVETADPERVLGLVENAKTVLGTL